MTAPELAPLDRPPQWVFVAPGGEAELAAAVEWLGGRLPALDWRGHLVPVWPRAVPGSSAWRLLLEEITAHLAVTSFARLVLHPVIEVSLDATEDPRWRQRVLEAVTPFETEAFAEQTESRLALRPILAPGPGVSSKRLLEVAEALATRLAIPSLLVGADAAGVVADAVARGMRVITPPPADRVSGILGRLREHHVVDGLLERAEGGTGGLLGPCVRHLVVDPVAGRAHGCLRAWEDGLSGTRLADIPVDLPELPIADCSACVPASLLAALPDLEVNGRRSEGRTLAQKLAVELAGRAEYEPAAGLAAAARSLAGTDAERAAAALLQGICELECGRPPSAEEALVAAAAAGADAGLVAYQRGRAQMAWRDEIEALERFAEALASSSPAVPRADVHLAMALAHVNLGEHAEALPHLERAAGAGREATLRFLTGFCRLQLGDPEAALPDLEAALALGPEADDEERVRLWLATCLKELDRLPQAIAVLAPAAAASDELAVHNLLGFCHYLAGDHAAAVVSFRRALAIDPRSAIDWSNLAANLRELGALEEAVAAYERALGLDPALGLARDGLARTRALLDAAT